MINTLEIQTELYKAAESPNRQQRLRHLYRKIQHEDAQVLYDALVGVVKDPSRPDTRYADQETAGGMLWALKPDCSREVKEEIASLMATYDVSVEEIPWYYADVFGGEAVMHAVAELLQEEGLLPTDVKVLQTWRFWLTRDEVSMNQQFRTKWGQINEELIEEGARAEEHSSRRKERQ